MAGTKYARPVSMESPPLRALHKGAGWRVSGMQGGVPAHGVHDMLRRTLAGFLAAIGRYSLEGAPFLSNWTIMNLRRNLPDSSTCHAVPIGVRACNLATANAVLCRDLPCLLPFAMRNAYMQTNSPRASGSTWSPGRRVDALRVHSVTSAA